MPNRLLAKIKPQSSDQPTERFSVIPEELSNSKTSRVQTNDQLKRMGTATNANCKKNLK